MKVISVVGFTNSGKTTTIERIVKELRKRNYSVGSVKDIHFEDFEIDQAGTNTYRHKLAGSQLVTARGLYETDILYQEKLSIYEILRHYDHDYVILEGVQEINAPKIITAKYLEEIPKKQDDTTFLISGKIADQINHYKNYKAISALKDIETIVDMIEEVAFELLPDFSPKCCTQCGMSCKQLAASIIKGEKKREDCVLSSQNISLMIDGKPVNMVPFVSDVLTNNVLAVVKELDGYKAGKKIEIRIGEDFE